MCASLLKKPFLFLPFIVNFLLFAFFFGLESSSCASQPHEYKKGMLDENIGNFLVNTCDRNEQRRTGAEVRIESADLATIHAIGYQTEVSTRKDTRTHSHLSI